MRSSKRCDPKYFNRNMINITYIKNIFSFIKFYPFEKNIFIRSEWVTG